MRALALAVIVTTGCGGPARAPAPAVTSTPAPSPIAAADVDEPDADDNVRGPRIDVTQVQGTGRQFPPPPLPPQVWIGRTTVGPGRDRAAIYPLVRDQLDAVRGCYRIHATGSRPALAGTVTVRFTIAADGVVATATGDGVDPQLASCIAGVITAIRFPPAETDVEVVYPFELSPPPS